MLDLSEKIPKDWYRLGIRLGFDFEAVDGIQSNEHFESPENKALEMLKLWVKHNGDNATVEVLAGALGKAKRQDLKDWLQTQVEYTAAVIRICGISCMHNRMMQFETQFSCTILVMVNKLNFTLDINCNHVIILIYLALIHRRIATVI